MILCQVPWTYLHFDYWKAQWDKWIRVELALSTISYHFYGNVFTDVVAVCTQKADFFPKRSLSVLNQKEKKNIINHKTMGNYQRAVYKVVVQRLLGHSG